MTLQSNTNYDELRAGSGKTRGHHKTLMMMLLIVTISIALLLLISLSFPFLNYSLDLLLLPKRPRAPFASEIFSTHTIPIPPSHRCDLSAGEWVPNPKAPHYTNATCWAIHDHHNCIKHGRPDAEFLRWRWKPDACDLPVFNPAQFLELMRHKSLAFVGDNIARNQVQSLICLLSRVEYPIDVSLTRDENFKRWKYMSYNFTMAFLWTSHLIKSHEEAPQTALFHLYLDEPDQNWASQIPAFDYLLISSGHWFLRPLILHENGRVTGCHDCFQANITELGVYHAYRKAFRTAFRAILDSQDYKGITYMRTFSPHHFENGLWNEGGNCVRRRPFRGNETQLEGQNLELYMTQMEEFKRAEREGKKKGLKFRLLDTTMAMLMRPDGHPSSYGHLPQENVTIYNDCVHWCLPGPIDSWSDFLLEMLKMEGIRSAQERLETKFIS